MSEVMISPLEKTIELAYKLPKAQQDSLAVIVEQFCKSVAADNKGKTSLAERRRGIIESGKYVSKSAMSTMDVDKFIEDLRKDDRL